MYVRGQGRQGGKREAGLGWGVVFVLINSFTFLITVTVGQRDV